MTITVRSYVPDDEAGWLRVRVLSFLSTAYFDDVVREHPRIRPPGFGLVAVDVAGGGAGLLGILDVSIDGNLATIDTVAVHPDHQHRGIGTALLHEALGLAVAGGGATIDAWTRDDEPTLRWYRARGFQESDHYLHVYANVYTDPEEPDRVIESARLELRPVSVFAHARLDREEELRRSFRRVHVCRRFTRALVAPG